MSESFEEFTERFLSDLGGHFKKIDSYKSKVTCDKIKMQMYCYEQWEEIDLKAIHSICNKLTEKYKSEFGTFNFSNFSFFSFNGEKGKITVKWFKNYPLHQPLPVENGAAIN